MVDTLKAYKTKTQTPPPHAPEHKTKQNKAKQNKTIPRTNNKNPKPNQTSAKLCTKLVAIIINNSCE